MVAVHRLPPPPPPSTPLPTVVITTPSTPSEPSASENHPGDVGFVLSSSSDLFDKSIVSQDLEKGVPELDSPTFRPDSCSTPRLPGRLSWSYAPQPSSNPAPHSWGDPDVTPDGITDDPSYLTSTPPRKRNDGVFGVQRLPEDYESSASSHECSVPYPDVFDLDMYYRDGSQTSSEASDPLPENVSSRESIPLALLIPSKYGKKGPTLPKNKRHAYQPTTPATDTGHEVKRYRDHYRPPHYSRPPRLCAEEPTSPRSLNKANPMLVDTEQSDSDIDEHPPTPPGLNHGSPRTHRQRPVVPVVIVSQYSMEDTPRSSMISHYSGLDNHHQSSQDSLSVDALKNRLKETCAAFRKSVYSDDSNSESPASGWDPVPF